MRPILFVLILLWCVPVQAEEYIEVLVNVPVSLAYGGEKAGEGEKWHHFTQATMDEKAKLFIEKCVLAPEFAWVRNFVITWHTKGRITDWEKSGITVEVYK